MEDSRHHKMFTVEGVILAATDVEIVNMSTGGVSLLACGRLDIGKEYTLKIEEKGSTCILKGTVVWSILSGSKKSPTGDIVPIYKAGLKFIDVKPEEREKILLFIERHRKSPEQRVVVRFDVRSPEKAVLNSALNCKVKNVSRGGVLLETERPFRVDDTFSMCLVIGGNRDITFLGRIASCIRNTEAETELYDVGIAFLEMSASSRKTLEDFIGLQ
ncbi:MAG TPA: PilZ domain-containing protein [Thermodesulfovibrionales bacterium]|jgi:c-di-GMP-binding flagellar brake protein YcgR|nr:PilZ domain-containing protein [Thermodesulfovibrionales bacterium]